MLVLIGPLGVIAPVVVTTALSCLVIGAAIARGRLLEAFPSVAWTLFMQLPFILVSAAFAPDIARMQSFGIAAIALALAAGDAHGLRRPALSYGQTDGGLSRIGERAVVIGLAAMVIYLPLYHVIQAGQLPILDRFLGEFNEIENAEQREAFGKFLDVPVLYKYAFNWVLAVFGPVLMALLMFRKRWIWASGLFVWLYSYAILSTAKQPLLIFVIFTGCATAVLLPRLGQRLLRAGMICALVGMALYGSFRAWEIVHEHNATGHTSTAFAAYQARPAAQDPLRSFTLGDADRLRPAGENIGLERSARYLVYRTMLTPVEVSHHWYAYFPQVSEGWRAPMELAGKRREGVAHAANRVGRWAYVERFPNNYLPSVSAYASIDADAYAFAGLFGVVLAAFGVLGIRVLASYSGPSDIGRVVRAVIIAQLGMLPVSASLQAMLIPQGLALLAMIAALLVLAGYRRAATVSSR